MSRWSSRPERPRVAEWRDPSSGEVGAIGQPKRDPSASLASLVYDSPTHRHLDRSDRKVVEWRDHAGKERTGIPFVHRGIPRLRSLRSSTAHPRTVISTGAPARSWSGEIPPRGSGRGSRSAEAGSLGFARFARLRLAHAPSSRPERPQGRGVERSRGEGARRNTVRSSWDPSASLASLIYDSPTHRHLDRSDRRSRSGEIPPRG